MSVTAPHSMEIPIHQFWRVDHFLLISSWKLCPEHILSLSQAQAYPTPRDLNENESFAKESTRSAHWLYSFPFPLSLVPCWHRCMCSLVRLLCRSLGMSTQLQETFHNDVIHTERKRRACWVQSSCLIGALGWGDHGANTFFFLSLFESQRNTMAC